MADSPPSRDLHAAFREAYAAARKDAVLFTGLTVLLTPPALVLGERNWPAPTHGIEGIHLARPLAVRAFRTRHWKPLAPPLHWKTVVDFAIRVCMNACMKTITLDEDAYERLKSWKRRGGDSFSAVVKRVVPRAGTLEAMARFAVNRALSSEERDALLESAIENRSVAKQDPWN